MKENFIAAVQVFNGVKGPEIENTAFRKISNPGELQVELQAFLREENFKTEMVITCLPSSQAFIRDITLTVNNPKVVEKIIKFQLEPYIPGSIEDMLVDFLDPGADGSIPCFGVEKKHLAVHLARLAGAGIEPDVVTFDSVALLDLYISFSSERSEMPVALVYLEGESILVEIIYEKRLDFLRVFGDTKKASEQIADTFRLYKLKRPAVTVNEILITGFLPQDTDLLGAIESNTGIKTSLWQPLGDLGDQKEGKLAPLGQEMCIPLALARYAARPSIRLVNLRKEEFVPKTHMDLRKIFLFSASAILLIALLLTVGVYQKVFYLEKQDQGLQNQISQVIAQSFPEAGRIIKGREIPQLEQMISAERERFQGVDEATAKEKTLDVLLKLTKIISEDPEVQIDNLSLEAKDIRLDGRTPSFEVVDRLTNRLTKAGDFKNIKLVGAKMDRRENAVTFNFALEKNE
ncbi:MAG: PilN domain-containing protein [Deltaproteobacteria bacterium]|nr:PilN domain-containing protein [Deltaproteobacteria bacterium]